MDSVTALTARDQFQALEAVRDGRRDNTYSFAAESVALSATCTREETDVAGWQKIY